MNTIFTLNQEVAVREEQTIQCPIKMEATELSKKVFIINLNEVKPTDLLLD
jgi:stress response protein YsnF